MSGRRSRSSVGSVTGMTGGSGRPGAGGSVNSAGALPIKVAMACSSCARVTSRSVAWARVVSRRVCACATSTPETTPCLNRFTVICIAFS